MACLSAEREACYQTTGLALVASKLELHSIRDFCEGKSNGRKAVPSASSHWGALGSPGEEPQHHRPNTVAPGPQGPRANFFWGPRRKKWAPPARAQFFFLRALGSLILFPRAPGPQKFNYMLIIFVFYLILFVWKCQLFLIFLFFVFSDVSRWKNRFFIFFMFMTD